MCETVLAAATRLDYYNSPMLPAWAAGSGVNLAKFPVLPGVKKLILLVDPRPSIETLRFFAAEIMPEFAEAAALVD